VLIVRNRLLNASRHISRALRLTTANLPAKRYKEDYQVDSTTAWMKER
jgi:hypothetical protein